MLCRPLKIPAHHSIAFFDHRYMASSTHRHPGRSLHITTNAGTNVVMCSFSTSERVFEVALERWIRRHIIWPKTLYYGGCFFTSLHSRAEAEDTSRTPPPPPWRTWTSLRSRRRRECRNQSLDIPTHVADRSAPKGYLICKYYSLDIKWITPTLLYFFTGLKNHQKWAKQRQSRTWSAWSGLYGMEWRQDILGGMSSLTIIMSMWLEVSEC